MRGVIFFRDYHMTRQIFQQCCGCIVIHNGLGHIVVKSLAEILFPCADYRIGSQNDYYGIPAQTFLRAFYKVQRLYAVKLRHHMVKENNIVFLFRRHFNAKAAASRSVGAYTELLQHFLHYKKVYLAVVSNKNLC